MVQHVASQASAFTFEKSSRKLKEAMFWKKVKLYMLALSAVGFVVFIITWVACGADFGKCKSDDSKK